LSKYVEVITDPDHKVDNSDPAGEGLSIASVWRIAAIYD
jgi:hypothetical protein